MYIKEGPVNNLNAGCEATIVKAGDGYLIESDNHTYRPLSFDGDIGTNYHSPIFDQQKGHSVLACMSWVPQVLYAIVYHIDPLGNCNSIRIEPTDGEFLSGQGDDHRSPVITFAPDGRIIMVMEKGKQGDSTLLGDSNHGSNWMVWVTDKPYDISTFRLRMDIPSTGAYPHIRVLNNKLLLIYRTFVNYWFLEQIEVDLDFKAYKKRPIVPCPTDQRIYIFNVIDPYKTEMSFMPVWRGFASNHYFYPSILRTEDGITYESADGEFSKNLSDGFIQSSKYVGKLVKDNSVNSINAFDFASTFDTYEFVFKMQNGNYMVVDTYHTRDGSSRTTRKNQLLEITKDGDYIIRKLPFIESQLPWLHEGDAPLHNGIQQVYQMPDKSWRLWMMGDTNSHRLSLFKTVDFKKFTAIKTYTIDGYEAEDVCTTNFVVPAEDKTAYFIGSMGRRDVLSGSNAIYIEHVPTRFKKNPFVIVPFEYEPEYQAILDRATTLGYTLPSVDQSIANNNKIIALKAEGVWNSIDVLYYTKQEAGLAEFCTLNWKDPENFQLYQANPALVPLYVPNQGFSAGVAEGRHFRMDYNPSTDAVNVSQASAAVLFKAFNVPPTYTSPGPFTGGRTTTTTGQVLVQYSASNSLLPRVYNSIGSLVITPAQMEDHVLIAKRSVASNDTKIYVGSNTLIASTTGAASAIQNIEMLFLAWNNNGTPETALYDLGLSYLCYMNGIIADDNRVALYDILNS